jgi:hypothetical protein
MNILKFTHKQKIELMHMSSSLKYNVYSKIFSKNNNLVGGIPPEYDDRPYVSKIDKIAEKLSLKSTKTIAYNNFRIEILTYENLKKDLFIKILNPKENDCVLILIEKGSNQALIENISNSEGCIQNALIYKDGGKILFRIILKYLLANKDIFGINRITLSDKSLVRCSSESHETHSKKKVNLQLQLADLYMLTHGDTWYGKFGFLPYDAPNNRPNIFRTKKYKEYKEKIDTLQIKDYPNLYKLIIETYKRLKVYHFNEEKIYTFFKENYESLVKDVLRKLFRNKFPFCYIYDEIKDNILEDLNIQSLYDRAYYLDI